MIEYDKPLDAMGCFPYGGSNGHAKGSWECGSTTWDPSYLQGVSPIKTKQ